MATPLLQTKLYIPAPRPELVPRSRLIERLNASLHRKLTLVSAPAGFGKTTMVSEWVASHRSGGPRLDARGEATPPTAIAWLSLDESDNDLTRFLTYLIGALQTVEVDIGKGWSKGGFEVVLFPYKAGIDRMSEGLAVSFFAPDEDGHEVRFALSMYTKEKARELAEALRGTSVGTS